MSIPIKTKITYPVTLSEAKAHLNINDDVSVYNTYLQSVIYAATRKAENYIGKDIAYTHNCLEIFDWIGGDLYLDEGNFISLDEAITDASLVFTVDHIDKGYNRTYVEFNESYNADPLVLTYHTGYDPSVGFPEDIKQAILIKIADYFDIERQNYSLSSFKENKAFEFILDPYKIILF
jgi:hypothetical protein